MLSFDRHLFISFYEGKNLPCKSKMVPYYVFATSMLWRRLLPLVIGCLVCKALYHGLAHQILVRIARAQSQS